MHLMGPVVLTAPSPLLVDSCAPAHAGFVSIGSVHQLDTIKVNGMTVLPSLSASMYFSRNKKEANQDHSQLQIEIHSESNFNYYTSVAIKFITD